MENTNFNPKALNKDLLYGIGKKVTLGFKCTPYVKLELIKRSEQVEVCLSEYVENIVSNCLFNMDHGHPMLADKNLEIERLKQRLAFYENERLITIYHTLKGKEIEYVNLDGVEDKIYIKSLKDIYTLVLASFDVV